MTGAAPLRVALLAVVPIVIVDIGRILFLGPVEDVAWHQAMVPVFGAGIDAPFEIDDGRGPSLHRATIVEASVRRSVRA